jgi:hypothetical protein
VQVRKRFTFVSGDRGAAKAQIPIAYELWGRGHEVIAYADAQGLAAEDIAASGLKHVIVGHDQQLAAQTAEGDLAVVGTSASATGLESAFSRSSRIPVVLASDGLFNHALPVWRDAQPLLWLAIDESHATAIRDVRLKRGIPTTVIVSGQPAFDDAIQLMGRRGQVRSRVRESLGIAQDTPLLVWWASGMAQVASEDAAMAYALLRVRSRPLAIAFRVHPKLDRTVGEGYCQKLLAGLYSAAGSAGASFVDASKVAGIELCLAADAMASITCTEDIKSTMIGGPPVVHFLGPNVREWMERDLHLGPPHYLPDVAAGLSLAAWDPDGVPLLMELALHPAVGSALRRSFVPPCGSATERTADILERL